ncbi:MAG: UPF0182 family protein [Candidatus Nanohaloarchaeota archaeon QJJ-7]|nr:UPF0182 family protein [Candidatus Nanohaloarchaeota archaeon QJJ-7]
MGNRFRRVYITAIILAFFGLPAAVNIYGEWLWFGSLDLSGVYATILSAKAGLFVAGTVAGFVILYGFHRWTMRNLEDEFSGGKSAVAVLAFLSLLAGGMAMARWETVLKYLKSTSFGVADPVFGMDVAFFVFHLPFYRFVITFALFVLLVSASVSLLLYALGFGIKESPELMGMAMGGMQVERTNFHFIEFMDGLKDNAYTHMMVVLGTISVLAAASVFLSRYELLFSQQGAVYGAGYTDIVVDLPVLTILAGMTALLGIVSLVNVQLEKGRYLAIAVAAVVGVAILGSAAGWAVQSYVVEPDEFNKERPHIENEINFTRQAYALERVDERQFPVSANLSREQIEANPGTMENVRLWDARPLLKTYNELQIFRTYYQFTDVDVDRYDINGSSRQVMVSPREIDFEALPPQSRSWVNRHLVYTHGYGLTMSPVREVSGDGLPRLIVKDIPPESDVGINVSQPRIYYGEETDTYTIVNSGTRELDYPKGDSNVYNSYDGSGGVELSSTFRELVYSFKFGAAQIFFSDSVEDDSRVQFHRDIEERAKNVAPFLQFDEDPYVVTENGKLYWIYDAYTTTDRYPYSRPVWFKGEKTNYVRNSVKVVVDAYSGDMDFYVAEPDDPLVQTYGEIFPELFKEMDEMPEDLERHVRYPEDMFSVQSAIYRDYHMKDPNVFYNREDQWRIPNEILRGNEVEMEPYYIIMTLPDEEEPEFMQILPFIPRGKENMIGWLAARSDPPNYGGLQAFQFSKQELVFGPMQVESRIDQDADISQQITLWSQSGSDVLRGNLLAIPIDDTVIYVEPLFLESREQGALPELKRVIVSHGDRLTMQPTLEDSLAVLFGEKEEEQVVVRPGAMNEVRSLFQDAREALQRGDFATYGEKIDEIEEILAQE